jgi:hypothetical protein
MDVIAPATLPFVDDGTEASPIAAPAWLADSSLPPPGQPPRA